MNGVDNQLFTGWMKGFADGGDDLVRKTKIITEAAGMLGGATAISRKKSLGLWVRFPVL
ncbi:hypothetical protein [Enterobacter cloacae complex sp. 284J4]|uniref:hypothetical protein n=1 Tax=Enterobacter cloacae complex sp. 284J4 TaxID=3395851 RepID=UPI003CF0FC4E